MAGLAHRDRRIGLVRRVQAERMQGVREVLALELVAGDAGAFTDRGRVGRVRVVRDGCLGKSRCC
jgi:hypothetical protein